ncbi:MAG: flagellar export chaperone FliS [Acidimicrobiales bacterium]|nr:flagellar export chaperone FliS [Acidimicrobiales bacterium]
MYAPTTTARSKFVADGVGTIPPERLLVLLYDRLLRDLDDATVAIGRGEVAGSHEALTHAQDIVAELHSALDFDRWDGAQAMADLYTWLADLLGRANITKSASLVAEARSLVQPLRDTWAEAYQSLSAASAGAPAASAGGLDLSG